MFEKVNPSHPDKVADRIAGALVDYAYSQQENPKIAVEVLIGHGECSIIIESSVQIPVDTVRDTVDRISGKDAVTLFNIKQIAQDEQLAKNQREKMRCGDNGIFKGVPTSEEEQELSRLVRALYMAYPSDGKYIIENGKLTICQSNAPTRELEDIFPGAKVNPLGDWTGGLNVDCGATNRKLGSDMGRAVTGGGLHGKDLSKADVAVNIYAYLIAQKCGTEINLTCAIGDDHVDGVPYESIVREAKAYVDSIGGFERLAEWGLI